MRQFDPIQLAEIYPADSYAAAGTCDACGSDLNRIVGRQSLPFSQNAAICERCYEYSRERSFLILLNDGEDVLCETTTLAGAMIEIEAYLSDPLEYGMYAPFRIEARNDDWGLVDHVATVDMPAADKVASRKKHGYWEA